MNEEIQFIECDKESEIIVENADVTSKQPFDERFPFFCVATLLHAVIYALFVYKNPSGLAYGAFVVSGMLYVIFCLKQMKLSLKKGSIFYLIAIIVLGIATFCTDDGSIIFLNKVAIFVLTVVFILDNMFNTKKWQFSKYISSAMVTAINSTAEIGSLWEKIGDYYKDRRSKNNSKYFYGLLGCVIALPVVVVMFVLLCSADIVFKHWAINIFGNVGVEDIVGLIFLFLFMFTISYCIMSNLSKKELDENVNEKKNIEPLAVIPVTLLLTLIYIIFSGIQIKCLFAGEVNLPDGYTYSRYAREGFFQLLAVSIINLIIVLVCVGYSKESKILKGILTAMSCCTFVMIASSAVRMVTYIRFYYLTFLRIFVLWSLLVVAFVFVGVIIYIYKGTFPIFKYTIITVTCLYIAFAFSRPDYFIAKVNLSSTDGNESVFFLGESFDDYEFMLELSADAAPAVAEWMEKQGYEYEIDNSYINEEYLFFYNPDEFGENYMCVISEETDDMGIRDFNVSRYIAKLLLP